MDLGSILLGLALLLLVAFIVARPILVGARGHGRAPRDGQADQLLFDRERLLAQLRDLDFDHATGKLADADHAAQRAELVAHGIEVLKQLDALGVVAAPANGAASAADDDIEAAIAAARRRSAPVSGPSQSEAIQAPPLPAHRAGPVTASVELACHNCGTAVQPADRFCPKCGTPQTLACAHCGRPARAGDQFCGGCGQRLPAVGTLN